MKLTNISRSKSIEMINGYGLKTWLRFGLEGELGEGEDPLHAYSELGKIIDQSIQEIHSNPHPQTITEVQVDKPADKIDGWIQVIELAPTITALENFKPSVDKANDQRLTDAYNKQMKKIRG